MAIPIIILLVIIWIAFFAGLFWLVSRAGHEARR